MMDQMDDVLIECDELEYDVQQPATSKTRSGKTNGQGFTLNTEIQMEEAGPITSHDLRSLPGVHYGLDRQTSSGEEGQTHGKVTAAIMMYSPDIPSAEGKNAYDTKPNLANYYATIETEETVKCVISTALFIAVVVAITLVAFLENPQM